MAGLHDNAAHAALQALGEELLLVPRDTHTSLYRWLIELRLSFRLYYLSDTLARDVIWPRLRGDEDLLEVILRGAVSFRLQMEGHEQGNLYREYCQVLGNALGELTQPRAGRNGGVTDTAFQEKMTNGTALKELLLQETWLTFTVTLERHLARIVPQEMLTLPAMASQERKTQ